MLGSGLYFHLNNLYYPHGVFYPICIHKCIQICTDSSSYPQYYPQITMALQGIYHNLFIQKAPFTNKRGF